VKNKDKKKIAGEKDQTCWQHILIGKKKPTNNSDFSLSIPKYTKYAPKESERREYRRTR